MDFATKAKEVLFLSTHCLQKEALKIELTKKKDSARNRVPVAIWQKKK